MRPSRVAPVKTRATHSGSVDATTAAAKSTSAERATGNAPGIADEPGEPPADRLFGALERHGVGLGPLVADEQARQLAQKAPGSGAILVKLLAEPQDVLTTMVLGNTVATAVMLATTLWMGITHEWPLVVTALSLLVLILIGCEVLPKTLAVRRPEQWSLRVARPLRWILAATRPFCRVAQDSNSAILRWFIPKTAHSQPGLTDADYQELLEMAYQQGALAQSEKETILQIISLDRRSAKEVMKPRAQMSAISDDLPIEDMIAAARKIKHRRLPIYDETPDTIVGKYFESGA